MSAGTFRDPSGSLFDVEGRILRLVPASTAGRFEALLALPVVASLVERRAIVATARLTADSVPAPLCSLDGVWFEHERVGFVAHPGEWPAEMLMAAALHTLDITDELLRHGLILKDATPSNVLFRDTRPVLVDVPSIEPLIAGSSIWTARHQFETTFLLPLMANVELGLPIAWSLSEPATGLSHERIAQMLGARRWLGLEHIRNVALPAALSGAQVSAPTAAAAVEPNSGNTRLMAKSQFVLGRSMAGLRRSILRLGRGLERRQSHWSGYTATRSHYNEQDLADKRSFVREALARCEPRWVIDIGANTGEFSEIAAERASTISIDLDEASVGAIYARAVGGKRSIQPLVVDISQPTPGTGWKNGERKSFLQRAEGRFDLAMMLAVVHHLRVAAGVPLAEIIDLGVRLGAGNLVFEFVPKDDPMFRAIARGREALYTDYSELDCERLLLERLHIEDSRRLSNGRTLFWGRRKG